MYFEDLGLTLLCLLGCAVAGWWLVAPFWDQIAFPVCVSVLAGLASLTLGTLALDVMLQATISTAMVASFVIFGSLSISALRTDGWSLGTVPVRLFELGCVIVVGAVAVWYLTATDRHFGAPAITFFAGTDQAGYAHIADWLIMHPASSPAAALADPSRIYESWPQLMFSTDPRFGSFTSLAMVAQLSGRHGMFAYDLNAAIITAAGVLGLAGVFARTRVVMAILAVGLLSSWWFDWTRGGFLAKIDAFPPTLLLAALFCLWADGNVSGERRARALVSMALLGAAAGLMWSGFVTGVFVALIGTAFLVSQRVLGHVASLRQQLPAARTLVLVAAIPLLSSGVLARPLYYGNPDTGLTWSDVLLHATEFQGLMDVGQWPRSTAAVLGIGMGVAWLFVGVFVVRRRHHAAAAWLGAPAVLLIGLYLTDRRWTTDNVVGLFYPMFLGGLALAIAAVSRRRAMHALTALLALVVVLHLPRFIRTWDAAGGSKTNRALSISVDQTDELFAAVQRAGQAYVETEAIAPLPLFLMVEAGRRGLIDSLQWSPNSWHWIGSYRGWEAPQYPQPAPLVVRARAPEGTTPPDLVLRNDMFDVVRRTDAVTR